ncbi:MAG: DUF6588 family protein, partial [Cyclobacteriaceae bacterium]
MKKLLIVFIFIFGSYASNAQDFDIFLEAGADDANQLLENYFSPVFKGFGYGLNGGWVNTAKPHKTLGIDLTVTANLARVPDADLLFNFANSDYSNVRLQSGTNADLPTFFGPTTDPDDLPVLVFNPDTENEVRFTPPQGLDIEENYRLNAVPVPMAQIGIGIVKNTDLKIRWTPEVDLDGEGTFKLIGFGIMHDIKQWIPGLKLVPIDLSAFVGYTSMSTEVFLNDDPRNEQKGVFDVNGLVIQGMVSKKFSILTVYGGLGFNSATTNFQILGDFDTEGVDLPTDPIDFKFNTTSPRATVGLRLKLAVLTIHADYT